ncbi:MAG: ATP-binding protein [Vicinamibacterales bacterium]
MTDLSSFTALAQTSAAGGDIAALLDRLHRQVRDETGCRFSLLFRFDARTGNLHPCSASGLRTLPRDVWTASVPAMRLVEQAFTSGLPVLADRVSGGLAQLWQAEMAAALLVPLFRAGEPVGLLALGLPGSGVVASATLEKAASIAGGFATALEVAQLRHQAELQREIRALLDGFSRVASSALSLITGLESCCRDAARMFGAERAAVWLHDRRARDLVLAAASDPPVAGRITRVPASGADEPIAVALRSERAAIDCDIRGCGERSEPCRLVVRVPLKGRRRALGVLVLDGVGLDRGTDLDVLEDADELGRQLSAAIENVQLLEEVIRSRREFASTLKSVPDLVAVCDARMRIVQVNEAFGERIGVGRERAIGAPIGEFLGLEARNWISTLDLWGKSASTQTFTREFEDPVFEGRHKLTVTTLIGTDGEPLGLVLVDRDLTTESKLEAERSALRDRLTEAEKMAILGQFVAGIAHELNNPLQSVIGHLELLASDKQAPAAIRRRLKVASREADRAAGVVRDLLVLAGRRETKGRRADVNAVVAAAIRAARRGSRRRRCGSVVTDLDPSLPRVEGDSLRLRQAFSNLLVNAIDAAGPEGTVRVRTRYWAARGLAVIEVHDSGPGIPAEALDRLFEPFFTTKEAGKGTGLGLTITKGVVQDHGGKILAANHQSGGAVFTVELPVGSPAS